MKSAVSITLLASLCSGCGLHAPSQTWKGLWIVEVETSRFCPAPTSVVQCLGDARDEQKKHIWLDFPSVIPAGAKGPRSGPGIYEVAFVGRRTLFPGHYGHFGMYDEEIVGDRMISIRKFEPRFSDAQMNQFHAADQGMKDECLEIIRWGGPEALTKPAEECYKFDPPRRWKGLWVGQFETSRFCPAPSRNCWFDTPGEKIWLQVGPNANVPLSPWDGRREASLLEVDFVGRKTSYRGSYGHQGYYDQEIVMDRVLGIKRVPMYSDLELAQMHAHGVMTSCLETIRWGGFDSIRDPEECYEKLPARRWRGLWRNDPVTSFFCPEPARKCPQGPESQRISLDFTSLPKVSGWNGLYKIDFIGRRTAHGGFRAGQGAAQDMVVDRLISVKEIEPPSKK